MELRNTVNADRLCNRIHESRQIAGELTWHNWADKLQGRAGRLQQRWQYAAVLKDCIWADRAESCSGAECVQLDWKGVLDQNHCSQTDSLQLSWAWNLQLPWQIVAELTSCSGANKLLLTLNPSWADYTAAGPTDGRQGWSTTIDLTMCNNADTLRLSLHIAPKYERLNLSKRAACLLSWVDVLQLSWAALTAAALTTFL